MALTIRLQRRGKIHKPFYHIVAADSRRARDGKFLEKLGYYDPNAEPSQIVVKEDRIKHWYSKGATISAAVANIAKKTNITLEREKLAQKN